MTPELRTDRLVLSPYVASDESEFVALFQDRLSGRWFWEGPDPEPEAETRALFGRIFSSVYAENRWPIWAVRHEGRFIGHAEIKPSPLPRLDGHEIVYGLTADSWGQGFGTEVAEALTSYGYRELQLDEVHATVSAENSASLNVLKKLGYVHVRNIPEDDGTTTQLLTHRRASDTVRP
ncbi:GNAT family N-acetyltransferase [Streptomyces sp. NBC_01304]|uniref:GNAT family N-acetyltransferase n=1 Tax=Streptomyces sp. NBC_01304 TaxID=2903818 RepID=UPI002E121AE5|nr:GNAT family N-acetyltransferase [Streptomyces sp. NBC_01304]